MFTDVAPSEVGKADEVEGSVRAAVRKDGSVVGRVGSVLGVKKRGRYLGGRTAAAEKPWEAWGISERTYYRRMKREKVE